MDGIDRKANMNVSFNNPTSISFNLSSYTDIKRYIPVPYTDIRDVKHLRFIPVPYTDIRDVKHLRCIPVLYTDIRDVKHLRCIPIPYTDIKDVK